MPGFRLIEVSVKRELTVMIYFAIIGMMNVFKNGQTSRF